MVDLRRLMIVLTLITAVAGVVLALVEAVTRGPIAAQRRLEMMRALQAVLPPVDNAPDSDTVRLVTGRNKKGQELERTFYRGRQQGELRGIAFQVTAPDGYSGNIEIMVGELPAMQRLARASAHLNRRAVKLQGLRRPLPLSGIPRPAGRHSRGGTGRHPLRPPLMAMVIDNLFPVFALMALASALAG